VAAISYTALFPRFKNAASSLAVKAPGSFSMRDARSLQSTVAFTSFGLFIDTHSQSPRAAVISATRVIHSLEIRSIDKALDIAILLERAFWPLNTLNFKDPSLNYPVTKRVMLEFELDGYEEGHS
jgi:hypothetical protein